MRDPCNRCRPVGRRVRESFVSRTPGPDRNGRDRGAGCVRGGEGRESAETQQRRRHQLCGRLSARPAHATCRSVLTDLSGPVTIRTYSARSRTASDQRFRPKCGVRGLDLCKDRCPNVASDKQRDSARCHHNDGFPSPHEGRQHRRTALGCRNQPRMAASVPRGLCRWLAERSVRGRFVCARDAGAASTSLARRSLWRLSSARYC